MSSIRTVPTDRVVAPAKLAHVVLRTAHHDEAITLVPRRCSGPVRLPQPGARLHLRRGAPSPHVGERGSRGARSAPGTPGLEHVAFTYASLGDLLATYRRLAAHGSIPAWSVNHGPTTSMYYVDPDGNQVELQVDDFECAEDLLAWFRTSTFAENPIGVPFDPERLVAAYEAGTPDADLLAPPGWAGPDPHDTTEPRASPA